MSDLIDVGSFGDPDQWLDGKGRLVRSDGTPVISDEDAAGFAKGFAEAMKEGRTVILPSYDHKGRCGPRWRPLRAWFGLTSWTFRQCDANSWQKYGYTPRCDRRYVWDRGQWRRLLSERQLEQLEREVLWK